jgi:hypothetical protein
MRARRDSAKFFRMMVAREGVEPPTPAFSATLCCVLNNLSDFGWPPKYLRSRERQENRGLEIVGSSAAPSALLDCI